MRLQGPSGWCLALVALTAACAPSSSEQAPGDRDDGNVRPTFCDRANDEVAELFCSDRGESIASLEDLKRELALDSVLLLGHSTSLRGRLASPINPRAILVRKSGSEEGAYTAAAFTRGEQRVELVSRDRDAGRFRFYLLAFSQACNEHDLGCTPGDLFTPAVETDWRELRVQDDEDLKNTPADCRRCHGGAPGTETEPILLMRELTAPWLHWFSEFSTLPFTYEAAKQGELYAGAATILRAGGEIAPFHEEPPLLEAQVREAELELAQRPQPLLFLSGVIGLETTELKINSSSAGTDDDPDLVSSPTWQMLYDDYREGLGVAPPYHREHATDPDKLAAASEAYRAYLAGDIERDELPDISDVHPDDQHQLAEMSFAVDPDATAEELLIQACGDCHNASLDQTISRARFDIDLSRVKLATLQVAIDRLERDEDDPSVMPPRGARWMSRAQRLILSEYLRALDPSDVQPRPPQEDFSEYGLELGYSYERTELPSSLVVIGDLSGDGHADLICSQMVFEQGLDGQFEEPAQLTASPLDRLALIDVNGDGRLDIVSRGAEPGDLTGLLTFLSEGELEISAGIPSVGPFVADLARGNFIDVDRDGHIDLVTRTGLESDTIVVYRGDGQGAFTAVNIALQQESDDRWAALTLGDVTGDDEADLVLLQRQPSHAMAVYAHDGIGGFEPRVARYALPAALVTEFNIAVGDANADGRNDVAISPGTRLMLQDERGRFGVGPMIAINAGPATFFDMNADGLDDLVAVASTRGEVSVLLQGARGLTRPAASVFAELPSTPGYVIDVLEIGDVSDDGCPDVAVARLGSLMVLHGTGCER